MTSTIAYTTDTPTAFLTRMADALSVPNGTFCFDPRTRAEVRYGYTMADNPDTETYYMGKVSHEDIHAWLLDHASDVLRPGVVVCGWRHGDTGVVYLYTARVLTDLDTAATCARTTGNLIFTNLRSGAVIFA